MAAVKPRLLRIAQKAKRRLHSRAWHEGQGAGNGRGPGAVFVLIAQLDRLSSSQRRWDREGGQWSCDLPIP